MIESRLYGFILFLSFLVIEIVTPSSVELRDRQGIWSRFCSTVRRIE